MSIVELNCKLFEYESLEEVILKTLVVIGKNLIFFVTMLSEFYNIDFLFPRMLMNNDITNWTVPVKSLIQM